MMISRITANTVRSLPQRLLLIACLAFAGTTTAAEPTLNSLEWQCTQQFDAYFNVECVPQSVNAVPMGDSQAPALPPQRNSSPAGHDMRPVAARGNAEVFSTRAWRIPLFTRPANETTVARLLESVLCENVPACTVHYASNAGARNP